MSKNASNGMRVASSSIRHCPWGCHRRRHCGWHPCDVNQDNSNNCHPPLSGNLPPSCCHCRSEQGSVSKNASNGKRIATSLIHHCHHGGRRGCCRCCHCRRGWHPCDGNQDNCENCHPPQVEIIPPAVVVVGVGKGLQARTQAVAGGLPPLQSGIAAAVAAVMS